LSALVEAVMQHSFTSREILGLPKLLGDGWKWTGKNVDEAFLQSYWDRQGEWYLKNEWSEHDLAIVDGPDMNIHFFERNLIAFQSFTPWYVFKENKGRNEEFKSQARIICKIVKSDKILYIPERGAGNLPAEIDLLERVGSIDNYITELRRAAASDYEVEFN
jgi:hypothetical protein